MLTRPVGGCRDWGCEVSELCAPKLRNVCDTGSMFIEERDMQGERALRARIR